MKLAETIQYEREHREWSRNKLAKIMGVSYWVIVRVEKGETVPTLKQTISYAKAFNKSVHYMVTGETLNGQAAFNPTVDVSNLETNLTHYLKPYPRQEIAKEMHISVSSLYHFQHRKRTPRPDIIESMAKALHISIDDLLI